MVWRTRKVFNYSPKKVQAISLQIEKERVKQPLETREALNPTCIHLATSSNNVQHCSTMLDSTMLDDGGSVWPGLKWKRTRWASKLSALLSGGALEVYSLLSEEAAKDYDKVKIALMKRYDLTEDGYHRKFRASKPEVDESPDHFIVRLDRYLLRQLELSDTEQTFDGLKNLIVKEQFIDSCEKGHLKL